MNDPVNSNMAIEKYNRFWHLLGAYYKDPKWYIRAYNLFVIVVITTLYPLHLAIGLSASSNVKEIFRSLAMHVASVTCSVKHFLYYPQFKNMDDISCVLKELDEHVVLQEDREFYQKNVHTMTHRMLRVFSVAYELVGVTAVSMWYMSKQPSLMYIGWFPFDWKSSTWLHLSAVFFQIIGLQAQIVQNIANDLYVPLGLCLLSGHTKLLAARLTRIGYDKTKTEEEHYADLVECFLDYKRLMRFFFKMQETISWNMILQSVTNGVDICVGVFFIVFYADDIFEYGYALVLVIAMTIEFYPGCYYGSDVELRFHDLTYALFSCDWQNRSPAFKKSFQIFSEISLRPGTMLAKNFVKVHLDTCFKTIRLSYSLFAVILNLK